ncbi:MAG: calcium-binding protein [Selenomonadaceae bacterium]|nr:calcium-binding protein [Selenomonadaceae bacterium]
MENFIFFDGSGNVSLSNEGVVLGSEVNAKGFGEGESFILAESGNVTVDSKIFELDALENIPTKITVTGAENGFIFSREITKESEEYLGYYDSPDIGKISTEKFISLGDDNYTIKTDSIGLEEVIGVSDGVTVIGGATLGDENTFSYYDLITDAEGNFTIDKRAYKVVGDSNVRIRARFEDNDSYASKISDLNGTISGDFSGGEFKISNSGAMKIFNDTDIDIVADENYFEIRGLDIGAGLQVSEAGNYIVNSTSIYANAGDIIVGKSDGTAWVASENNIDNGFNNSSLVIGTENADAILNKATSVTIDALGGNDLIVNNADSTVTAAEFGNLIYAGTGDDTIYNHHTYNPTIYGGEGNDSIAVSRGHKTFADGGEGNDIIIGQFANSSGSDWAMGGYATILGGNGDDYINTGYTNDSSIDGGAGNDTIITNGKNSTIDGGKGNNLIQLATERNDTQGQYIIFDGQTTIEGFNFGFGEGADTVYFKNNAPACDFKDEGFTLYGENGQDNYSSLTFAGDHNTTKLNFYYEKENKIVKAVFLPSDAWYTVEEGDFFDDENTADDTKKETYFVGASATPNQGINFSNISEPLNVTLNTEYEIPDVNFWVNNIHSIVGGAGDTTITGSEKSDTIIGGSGNANLWGGSLSANDILVGGDSKNIFRYYSGNGNDTIRGTNNDDEIIFSDISLDQIVSTQITPYSVSIYLNDGGSVYVEGRSDVTYQLADGSKYSANHETLSWDSK